MDTLREPGLNKSKIVLFTEYASTAIYIQENLKANGFDTILYTSSTQEKPILHSSVKNKDLLNIIKEEFDVDFKGISPYDNKQLILICTDMLSEGINLHKSNVLINYDLPWNPVRIMQRLGRVNRIGSKSKDIFIKNFLPTLNGEEILYLKKRISHKLSEFKQLLGDDNKYIDINEDVGSKKLFTVNNTSLNINEEKAPVEDLKWILLNELRHLKETDKELYNSIVRLPENSISILLNNIYFEDSLLITVFSVNGILKTVCNSTDTYTGIFDITELSMNNTLNLSLCYSTKSIEERLRETKAKSMYMKSNNIVNKFDNRIFSRIALNIEYIQEKYGDQDIKIILSEYIYSR